MAKPGIERLNKVKSKWIHIHPYIGFWIYVYSSFRNEANKNGQRITSFRLQRRNKIQNAYRIHHIEANVVCELQHWLHQIHYFGLRDVCDIRHLRMKRRRKRKKKQNRGKKQSIQDQFLFFVQNSKRCRMELHVYICCMCLDAMYGLCEWMFANFIFLLAFSFAFNSVFFILFHILVGILCVSTCLFAPDS